MISEENSKLPAPNSKTPETLALVTQRDGEASASKEIQARVKVLGIAIKGHRRAASLMFAYAAVGGAQANRLAEIMDHGELEKLLERRFKVPQQTMLRWRQFAKDLAPALSKRPTVGLLDGPQIGKTIPAKQAEAIQAAVLEVMDGNGMVEFMRDCKLLREVEEPGGYKPDVEMFEKWKAQQEPPLPAETKYDDLKPGQQLAFRRFAAAQAGPRETPEKADEKAARLAEELHAALTDAVNCKWVLRVEIKLRQSLQQTAELVRERLEKLNKASK